jgi:hypothetical protein
MWVVATLGWLPPLHSRHLTTPVHTTPVHARRPHLTARAAGNPEGVFELILQKPCFRLRFLSDEMSICAQKSAPVPRRTHVTRPLRTFHHYTKTKNRKTLASFFIFLVHPPKKARCTTLTLARDYLASTDDP